MVFNSEWMMPKKVLWSKIEYEALEKNRLQGMFCHTVKS